mmetsp:Transcript_28674/g.66113  ORF Transcript_28674/g.66113 Transcript_28674/m.66113 type:complete len:262 (-) Transcript_28674:97-882(-)
MVQKMFPKAGHFNYSNNAASAAAAVTSPMQAAAWQLVWCYEHNQASENQAERLQIETVAASAAAGVVMFRKASQFAKWLETPSPLPYVLVTDWREAQPCVRALCDKTGQGSENLPLQIVVFCKGQRQIMRATNWAKILRPDLVVHICDRSNIPDFILNGLIRQCFSPVEERPLLQLQPPKLEHVGAYDGGSMAPPMMPFSANKHCVDPSMGGHAVAQAQRQLQLTTSTQVHSLSDDRSPNFPLEYGTFGSEKYVVLAHLSL